MMRRFLIVAVGTGCGFLLAGGAAHLALSWNLFPNRELNRSTDYVREVLKMVHENYVVPEKASYEKLTREALHGMVETLDPHSDFLEEKEMQSLDEDMRGDFGGVGIQVETREGRVLIIAPIAGGPGERVGLRRGDEIIAVDGKGFSRDVNMDDVIERLRGKPGTEVALRYKRDAKTEPIEVKIVRERIKVDSVKDARLLSEGIGYLHLVEFSERTADEFGKALDKLLEQGCEALVLDLRNNPGGLLDAAVYVAEPFFPKGELIVYTQGRKASDREEFKSEIDGPPLRLPLAVLINAGSASAAEIVAGALKDSGRAVLIGERSFGKGSVQSVFKLKKGEGLRLTTARYYTPSGVTIHEKGVVPHIEIVMTPEEDEKLRLQRLRGDLSDPESFAERFGFKPIEDRQLQTAVEVLKGVEILEERGVRAPSARRKGPALR